MANINPDGDQLSEILETVGPRWRPIAAKIKKAIDYFQTGSGKAPSMADIERTLDSYINDLRSLCGDSTTKDLVNVGARIESAVWAQAVRDVDPNVYAEISKRADALRRAKK